MGQLRKKKMIKPVNQPTQSKPFYREEKKWDQSKMRIVSKKIPCTFQEMLEAANAERERIEQNDKRSNR